MKRIGVVLVLALSACGTTSSGEGPPTAAPSLPSTTSAAPSRVEEACIDEDAMRSAIDESVALMDGQDPDRATELAIVLDEVAAEIEPVLMDVAEEFRDAGDEFRKVERHLHPLDLVRALEAYSAGATAASDAANSLVRALTTEDYC